MSLEQFTDSVVDEESAGLVSAQGGLVCGIMVRTECWEREGRVIACKGEKKDALTGCGGNSK